jgi:hypothetical protein
LLRIEILILSNWAGGRQPKVECRRGVAEALDELEDLADQFASGRPGAAMHELFLERGEGRLGDAVVPPCPLGAWSSATTRQIAT